MVLLAESIATTGDNASLHLLKLQAGPFLLLLARPDSYRIHRQASSITTCFSVIRRTLSFSKKTVRPSRDLSCATLTLSLSSKIARSSKSIHATALNLVSSPHTMPVPATPTAGCSSQQKEPARTGNHVYDGCRARRRQETIFIFDTSCSSFDGACGTLNAARKQRKVRRNSQRATVQIISSCTRFAQLYRHNRF